MLKRIALLAPLALIATAIACGGESPSTTGEDEQGAPQANGSDEARTRTGDGVADEPVGSSEEDLRGGGAPGGGGGEDVIRQGGGRGGGVVVGGRRGSAAHIGAFRRGWIHGRWTPGWGWRRRVWVLGGTAQYSCVTDLDCAGPLGPSVAVCAYDPTVAVGYCVAPNW